MAPKKPASKKSKSKSQPRKTKSKPKSKQGSIPISGKELFFKQMMRKKERDFTGVELEEGFNLHKYKDLKKVNALFEHLRKQDFEKNPIIFNEAKLIGFVASGIYMPYVKAQGANLEGAIFSGANFVMANFEEANLVGVNFSGARLTGANFKEAKLEKANFEGAGLVKANFYRAKLMGAFLSNASFHDANLYGANLTQVDLTEADLRLTELVRTRFYGADLSGADITGAKLDETKFEGAYLVGIKGLLENKYLADADFGYEEGFGFTKVTKKQEKLIIKAIKEKLEKYTFEIVKVKKR